MENKEKIKAQLLKNLEQMAQGADEIEKLWLKAQGTDLDALALRVRIFRDVKYCAKCGRELDFIKNHNGIPQCLMPCQTYR